MKHINTNTFGPWALVTGASSGIGKEFARQLAQVGLNLVLVARRLPLLEEIGRTLADEYGIGYRAMALDLSQEDFLERLETVTRDLDIGLVVSNAGSANPGEFLSHYPAICTRRCGCPCWRIWIWRITLGKNWPHASAGE